MPTFARTWMLLQFTAFLVPLGRCISPFTNCETIGCWHCPNGTCTQCWQAWGMGASGKCVHCGVKGLCQDGRCASGFIRKSHGCTPCADNCGGCEVAGSGKCDPGMCRPGFAVAPDGTCAQCPKKCHSCNALGSCDLCERGFTVSADTTSCVACGAFCNSCSEGGKCDRGHCYPGFALSSDGLCKQCDKPKVKGVPFTRCDACEKLGPGTCDAVELCAGGREKWGPLVWTLDSAGKCQQCSRGCKDCRHAGPGKCDAGQCAGTASQPMGLAHDGRCAPCPQQCFQCVNTSRCNRCITQGHPLIQLTAAGECISCSLYCNSCLIAGAGLCDPGHCHSGFGPAADGTCIRCPDPCLACASGPPGICQRCRLGLGLLPNGTCAPCPQHCEVCTQADVCDAGRCSANFELSNGRCQASTGRFAVPSRSVRAPTRDGVLVIPVTVPVSESSEGHCLRLLDLESGNLIDNAAEFCMPWDNTIGLQCSMDAHRGVFYLAENQFIRRIDMDTGKQIVRHEVASQLDVMTIDTVLDEVIGVVHVFSERRSYTVSVQNNGMLRFWSSQWRLSGTWGHNNIASWRGAAAVPTFKFPLFSLIRDKAPIALSSNVLSWAAIRFDESSGKLYAIGRQTTMHDAKDTDVLSLYELPLLAQEHNSVTQQIVRAAVQRCPLLGLYRVFEGDRGSYSFLAKGRLHVVAAQSPNHLRDRFYFVDVDTCETGWLNWTLPKALGQAPYTGEWTCIADRAALLKDGMVHPMHPLPEAPLVAQIPAEVPSGFGCFEDPNMHKFMLAEHVFLKRNAKCMSDVSDTSFWSSLNKSAHSQKRCDTGEVELRANCSQLRGQLCTARVRSGPQRDRIREAPACLPASCLKRHLARLATRDDTIYRWCPTLPFMPNQFLYNCDLHFYNCSRSSPPVSSSSFAVRAHESTIPIVANKPSSTTPGEGTDPDVPTSGPDLQGRANQDIAAKPSSNAPGEGTEATSAPGLEGTLRGMLIGAVVGGSVGAVGLLVWRCGQRRLYAVPKYQYEHESELVGVPGPGDEAREAYVRFPEHDA